MSHLILFAVLFGFWSLLKKDQQLRDGVSNAIWIPTLWIGITASRPLSTWFGLSGGSDTLEGSPMDRLFFLVMIIAAFVVLSRRRFDWGRLIANNWALFIFYGFLLVSIFWANSTTSSFKRWFKEFGNIAVILVILTEVNPLQALRAVFVRCAYLLIPLSIVFIRYFPELGRRYSQHSGNMEATGVTFQKNALGTMILVCGLMLLWDWLERSRPGQVRGSRLERWAPPIVLAMGAWLLIVSDSKTSMLCFALGGTIIAAVRLPVLRRRISALGIYTLAVVVGFFLLDWMFGISTSVITSLGRDMTFTGRTDVWRELLNVGTDPVLGTGFMSFWDDARYQTLLPEWIAFSAHNGYLEVYLAGGFVGVALLTMMILATGFRINRSLGAGGDYAVVRFAIFVITLIANFSESNFACMTPLGFLFLLATIGHAQPETAAISARVPVRSWAGARQKPAVNWT